MKEWKREAPILYKVLRAIATPSQVSQRKLQSLRPVIFTSPFCFSVEISVYIFFTFPFLFLLFYCYRSISFYFSVFVFAFKLYNENQNQNLIINIKKNEKQKPKQNRQSSPTCFAGRSIWQIQVSIWRSAALLTMLAQVTFLILPPLIALNHKLYFFSTYLLISSI